MCDILDRFLGATGMRYFLQSKRGIVLDHFTAIDCGTQKTMHPYDYTWYDQSECYCTRGTWNIQVMWQNLFGFILHIRSFDICIRSIRTFAGNKFTSG